MLQSKIFALPAEDTRTTDEIQKITQLDAVPLAHERHTMGVNAVQ